MGRMLVGSLLCAICFTSSAYGAPAVLVAKKPRLACPQTELGDADLQARYATMWERYSAEIDEATKKVRGEIEKQTKSASATGNLDLALFWKTTGNEFEQKGELRWDEPTLRKAWNDRFGDAPFPAEFGLVVKKASEAYASATKDLEKGYSELVTEFTKAEKLHEALKVRGEIKELLAEKASAPEPSPLLDKPKPEPKPATNGFLRAKASDAEQIVRVRYHFGPDGSCKLETVRLKSKPDPVPDGYKKEDKGNGIWQITETFENENSLERFSGPISEVMNVSFAAERQALAFSPKAGGNSKAVLLYPQRCRLPLTIEADLSSAEQHGHFQINPNASMPPNIHPFANVFTHDGGNTLDLSCSWVVSRDAKKGEPTIEELFSERGVSTNKPFSREARAPVGSDPEMIYLVRLGAFGAGPDSSTLYLRRLSVTGRFAPMLGLSIKQEHAGDPLVAAAVVKNSLAEKAGLKVGDVVTAVDGKSPNTVLRALQLLSMTNYGESWNIQVERDGQKKTFEIKAE